MESSIFSEKVAPEDQPNFGVRFRVSYFALFCSLFYSLTWTINVGVTRSLFQRPSHATPAISDSTFNRYQHPYYVLFMTASMCLLFVLAIFIRTLQFVKPGSFRAYLCNFGMVSALFATVFTAMSTAIIVQSKQHFLFGMLGGAGTGIWLVMTATFPPCAKINPWTNVLVRTIAVLAGLGGLLGASSFSFNSYQLGAVGEYISVGGFCLFIAGLAVKIHGYEVMIRENAVKYSDFPEAMENIFIQRRDDVTSPFPM